VGGARPVTALLLSVLMLVANGVFVAAEFSFIAAGKARMERLADDGDARARVALVSMKEISFLLSACQLGITVASLVLGYLAEPALAHLLEGPLHDLGLPESTSHTVAFVVALAIVVFLHMVVGEMVPKNIAIAEPERTSLFLARPMAAFTTAFRPVVRALNAMANAGLRLLRVEPVDELSLARTGEEIATMLAASRREGLLEEVEHRLMTGALRFPLREVGSVMVPKEGVVAVAAGATAEQVERVAVDSGHSRIVLYGRDLDEVLGFVHAKDLLGVADEHRRRPLRPGLVRRMLVVPAGGTLHALLLAMRRARVHMALVTDAEGRTAGVVSLEDVLEALVGDIRDEHDARAGG
jgi:CBS domain containing-hemolysin-like protein